MNGHERPDDDIQRAHAMVDDADCVALFAQRAPNPTQFAAGIAARLRDREAQPPARKAAAWLPIEAAGLVGKNLWFVVSVPALLLVAVVAAFGSAARLVQGVAQNRGPAQNESQTQQIWRQTIVSVGCCIGFAVAMVASALYAPHALRDAFLLGLLVSMFVLVLGLRSQARAGSMERAQVASLCIETMWGIALVLMPLALFDNVLDLVPSPLTTFAALGIGIVALVPLALRSFLGVLTVVGIAFAATTIPGSLHLAPAKPTLAAATQAIASAEFLGGQVTSAPMLVDHVLELRAHGGAVDLRGDHLEAMRSQTAASPPNAFAATALARLGAIDAEAWATIASNPSIRYALSRLALDKQPLVPNSYDDYLVHCLLATNQLDDRTRDRLADRLVAGIEQPHPLPLLAAAQCVRWLDLIGRGALVDARRDRLLALLTAHQVTTGLLRGRFCRNPQSLAGAEDDSTDHALALLHRLGPTSIDHRMLHRALARRMFLPMNNDGTSWVGLRGYRQWLSSERLGQLPAPTLGTLLVEERLTIAVIAFVLLCLYATWLVAPRRTLAGALP